MDPEIPFDPRYFLDSDPSYLWTFAKRWQLSSAQLTEFKTFTREQNYSDLVSRELATGERWRNGGEMERNPTKQIKKHGVSDKTCENYGKLIRKSRGAIGTND
jgi:hypothetical protein